MIRIVYQLSRIFNWTGSVRGANMSPRRADRSAGSNDDTRDRLHDIDIIQARGDHHRRIARHRRGHCRSAGAAGHRQRARRARSGPGGAGQAGGGGVGNPMPRRAVRCHVRGRRAGRRRAGAGRAWPPRRPDQQCRPYRTDRAHCRWRSAGLDPQPGDQSRRPVPAAARRAAGAGACRRGRRESQLGSRADAARGLVGVLQRQGGPCHVDALRRARVRSRWRRGLQPATRGGRYRHAGDHPPVGHERDQQDSARPAGLAGPGRRGRRLAGRRAARGPARPGAVGCRARAAGARGGGGEA